jgi:probable addiction module antidote protein
MAKANTAARKHPPSVSHEEVTIRMFRDDPEFAAEYLNQVLEDGDQKELLVAMRRIAEAFGGVAELARRTNLHAKTLYRTLSPQGNPELKSLTALLQAMGMRIMVAPTKSPIKSSRRRVTQKAA